MSTPSPQNAFCCKRLLRLLWRSLREFYSDNVSRLGAALAFYTTVAVAPLLVVTLVVAGVFFGGQDAARERVLGEIEHLVGRQAGAVISSVQSPVDTSAGRIAAVVGSVTLVFGAFGVFYHLQGALNAIWHIPPPREIDWWRTLVKRLFSLAMVLATGFLLLVSLVISAFLSWLRETAAARFELAPWFFQAVNQVLSFAMVTLLLGVIFRLLPDTHVRWRRVWPGAILTAGLFTVGKSVLGFYLAHADVGSAYGAASSIIVLLLWCYYAAQILFFGAEFTRISHLSDGGRDFSKLDRPVRRDLSL